MSLQKLVLGITLLLCCLHVGAQDQLIINLDNIDNEIERVEIQRYTGYEDLLYRYTTLPYDVSANTGGQGRYFDIGYLIFALFPIVLLAALRRRKRWFYGAMIMLALYLCTSLQYTYMNINGYGKAEPAAHTWSEATASEQMTWSQNILATIYDIAGAITYPLINAISYISGPEDHVSYLILFGILMIGTLAIYLRSQKNSIVKTISLIAGIFLFYWVILSGGIIWYGFILLPILLAAIFKKQLTPHQLTPIWIASTLAITVWSIAGYTARVSNIDHYTQGQDKGKSIIDANLAFYTTGLHTSEQSQDLLYSGISKTIQKINNDNSYIYMIGTSLSFNIKNSAERIKGDNILSIFFAYKKSKAYRGLNIVDKMMRHSGFKYLIVDLYTPTLDQTPEKSLTKKFQLLLNDLYNSEHAKLLSTDRVLEVRRDNGQVFRTNAVFIKDLLPSDQLSVINHGRYAIFEL